MDFVAVDFETANARRSSPCSAGLVRFRDGQPVASWYQVMRPPAGHDEFLPINVAVHGITEAEVSDQPRFGDWWPSMAQFIGADVVVAHNAAFDMSVLRESLVASELALPDDLPYACTWRTSKVMLDLLSYSLPWVAVELGVPFTDHHNAAADALAAGQVMVALMHRAGVGSVAELCDQQAIPVRHLSQLGQPVYRRGPGWERTSIDRAALDHEHPLFDRVVVFTGGLDRLTRAEAWDEVVAVGGIPEDGVTKRTNVLVIGPGVYTGQHLTGDQMTGKMAKAAKLRAKDQDIEVMSEREFFDLLPGWQPYTGPATPPTPAPTPISAAITVPTVPPPGPVTLSSGGGVEVTLTKGASGVEVSVSFSGAEWEEMYARSEEQEARRDAERTPEQRAAWAAFEATRYSTGDPESIDLGVWPDGHPDLVEIAQDGVRRAFGLLEDAHGRQAKAAAAGQALAAVEARARVAPVISAYDAHVWLQAVSALPPDEGRDRFRAGHPQMTGSLTDIDTLEQRLADPSGRVTRPQTAQAKLHEARPWLELFFELGFTLGAEALATGLITMLENTGLDQQAADLALTAHASGGLPAGWVVSALTNAGRHEQAAEFAVDAHARGTLPAKDAVFALNAASRYQQAADLGRQAILDGVIDVSLADRMGILYERHLDDLNSALWVSQTALGGPLEYPGTKIDAIRKRRDRVQRKLTTPLAPAHCDEASAVEHLSCQTCGQTFTRTRTRGRKPHQCPACR